MKVYALIGKSGTGKSYQAVNLCGQLGINYIIDDGLLIGDGKVLAGKSAKRQATMMGAIKTAIFTDEDHRKEVSDMIQSISPDKIIVLGTSEKMVLQAVKRLGIPEPDEKIFIEDITTEEERELARHQRKDLGKHVIPVPTMQIKRQFSGYFLNPLRMMRKDVRQGATDRTVVRPTFSYLGEYVISDRVISNIVDHIARETDGLVISSRVITEKTAEGIVLTVIVNLKALDNFMHLTEMFQRRVSEMVEYMTGLNVEYVNIEVRNIEWIVPEKIAE